MKKKILTPIDLPNHPPYLYPDYKSTVPRSPTKPLLPRVQTLSELTGPVFGRDMVNELDADLTKNGRINGEPLGERIIVTGRLLDEDKRPIRNALIEVWQANASGRYLHHREIHDAPLDPNFTGGGRTMTNENGEYRFITIRPGAYPWGNHYNAWRPAHIHFSVFGTNFLSRLVTQMYFPGDPLQPIDPIFNSIPNQAAAETLIATYNHDTTEADWALGFNFDIVLGGTPFE
ncbi:MAG: protocatechuate 3,4-dioxygenase subunit beta [Chloroflexota bacterium]